MSSRRHRQVPLPRFYWSTTCHGNAISVSLVRKRPRSQMGRETEPSQPVSLTSTIPAVKDAGAAAALVAQTIPDVKLCQASLN